jgi:protein TonB
MPRQGTAGEGGTTDHQRHEGAKGSGGDEDSDVIQDYLQQIAQAIDTTKRYPKQARRKGWEGTVRIELQITSSGEVVRMTVIEPSSYKILDKAALDTFERAQPFAPFPEGLKEDTIVVRIPLNFTLKSR